MLTLCSWIFLLKRSWIAWKKCIGIEGILNLVNLCIRKTAFIFSGAFYSQFQVQEIWNISPLFYDIYMHHIQEKVFGSYIFLDWFRYTDDFFFMFLPMVIFLVCYLLSILLIVEFNSLTVENYNSGSSMMKLVFKHLVIMHKRLVITDIMRNSYAYF